MEYLDPTRLWLSASSNSFGWSLSIRYGLVLFVSRKSLDLSWPWPSALSHSFLWCLLIRYGEVLFLTWEFLDPFAPTWLWPSALSHSFMWSLSRPDTALAFGVAYFFLSVESLDPIHFSLASFGGRGGLLT